MKIDIFGFGWLLIGLIITFPLPSYGYKLYTFDAHPPIVRQPIQIQNQSVIISQNILQELASQIPKLDLQLQEQFQLFSIPLNREISLVYIHQGRNHWKINFRYGGYPIDTKDKTLYTTQEIYRIKQAFALTKKIDIAGKIYKTNSLMRQVGPILHSQGTGC